MPRGQENTHTHTYMGFSCGSAVKESACNAGDLDSIPGLGRSPGEGKGNPRQYSGLENSMDCMGLQRVGRDQQISLDFTSCVYIYIYIYIYIYTHTHILTQVLLLYYIPYYAYTTLYMALPLLMVVPTALRVRIQAPPLPRECTRPIKETFQRSVNSA